MAKVMVSMPDDLLQDVDDAARRQGTTRSGYLQKLAEEAIRERNRRRAQRMAEIDALGDPATGHGGNVAEQVKANRPRWPR